MTNLFLVLEAVRRQRRISFKQLSEATELNAATLISTFNRRPPRIAKDTLIRLCSALSIDPHIMANIPLDTFLQLSATFKLSTILPREAAFRILANYEIRDSFCPDELLSRSNTENPSRSISHPNHSHMSEEASPLGTVNASLRQSLQVMLKQLNSEGVLEVMKYTNDLLKNPSYCLKDTNVESANTPTE